MAQDSSADVISASALDNLPAADIYVLGELHDQKIHHDNQARAVAAIAPTALVFEMLTPEQAAASIGVARDDMAALDAALGWSETSWPEFELYFPVFAAAEGAAIYGAALPREVMRAAISTGAAEQFDGDAARFGLDRPLHVVQQARREKRQARAHCDALPADMLSGMVEAQRLRDASFAKTALEAFDALGGPVVVITGNGHALLNWGIPSYLARAEPEISVLSVGQIPPGESFPQYDLWLITELAQAQSDPCAAFQLN